MRSSEDTKHVLEPDRAAVLIALGTPGGLLDSTRDIVQAIEQSPVPVILYVSPSGSRAGSAGFFLLESADIAAMAPGTNAGAAHPVLLVGPMTIKTDELDYAPVKGPAYEPPKLENRNQLLAEFDKNVAEARASLTNVSDADMMKGWKLLAGGQEIFTMPRIACIRTMVLNHIIHHRAQLTVYYRLLGIPVPGVYGPSADEAEQSAAATK